MALRDDLLPIVEDLRGIGGELGFRRHEVYVRVRSWAGPRPNMGARTETTTQLLVNGQNPRVREVQSRDRVSGQANMVSGDWDIGPLTPGYVDQETINPSNDGTSKVVHYILKGDGMPESGLICKRISDQQDRPLRIMIRVRATGQQEDA